MLENQIKKFKIVTEKLLGPTNICKKCFKDIKLNNFYSFLHKDACLCSSCLQELESKFIPFKIGNIKALAVHEYDGVMQNLIYQFKGCYDIELKDIFLAKYKNELNLLFKGYTLIPAPSAKEDDLKRGFNHVEEIFKTLNLPLIKAIEKTEKFKQADHNFKERKQIKKYLKLTENLKAKHVLLVDDIYTTGATMKSMIELLKSSGIKDIKVLVVCKTILKEKI